MRRYTAHELAEYARCPRAWWYDRHEEPAQLDAAALAARLQVRRAALGRRAARDAEVAVLERLLERHERFAHGRAAHVADAGQGGPSARRLGCLPTTALLCAAALIVRALLVR